MADDMKPGPADSVARPRERRVEAETSGLTPSQPTSARGGGNTALGAATCRLIEQYEPPGMRLFDDSVVGELVGGILRMLMRVRALRRLTVRQTDAVMPGLYGLQVCRTRYIDDAATAALARGIDRVVTLGAGLDTRAYRLPAMARARVVEVDLPAVQATKRARLGRVPDHVAFVPIDFTTQGLEDVLVLEPGRPALFIWEGVTQYLDEDAVKRTLAFVGAAAPGTVLIFTYVLRAILDGRSDVPGAARIMAQVARTSAPWRFGLHRGDVAAFLRPFHLQCTADVGAVELRARYLGRRSLPVSPAERIVEAVVAGRR